MDEAELSRIQADPSAAEALFADPTADAAAGAVPGAMQERIRNVAPKALENAISALNPSMRKVLADRLGLDPAALTTDTGADAVLKLMFERPGKGGSAAHSAAGPHEVLSLDKAWHGVHYVLCGEAKPGSTLLSQAVTGGVDIGDDDEGSSGYGPARYFTAARVAELSAALSRPGLEQEAAARFDAARMSELGIYPGWEASHAEWVMDAFLRLRDFYADAKDRRRAIVTCLT